MQLHPARLLPAMPHSAYSDIRKAAEDIVNGCTFDNNLPCIAEKEIVAVDSVADELMHYMVSEQGCYRISKESLLPPDAD